MAKPKSTLRRMDEQTKLTIIKRLTDRYASNLEAAFYARFKYALKTEWNIFANRLVSSRVDGNGLSEYQNRYIAGYEQAHLDICNLISEGL